MLQFFKIRHYWIVVGILIAINVSILGISYWYEVNRDPSAELRQGIEASLFEFEKLSFWERLVNSRSGADEISTKASAFDGLEIDKDLEENVVAVMIDNFALIRDQHSGVRSASVVYETLVEGGITRLMLMFPYQDLDHVGPVRSARDYFVEIAEEFGGIYMHAGGSPTALSKLWNSKRVLDLDEANNELGELYSYRDANYDAPHDLYVDLKLARERAELLVWGLQEPRVDWCFESEVPSAAADQNSNPANGAGSRENGVIRIGLDYSNDIISSYYVQFRYDDIENNYKRYYGKNTATAHVDQEDGLQVAPINLIVQIAPSVLIPGDDKERLSMQNVGTGKAFYFMNGERRVGSWQKVSATGATKWLDANGQPICFNPGQTWVAILSAEELMVEGQ